MLAPIEAGVNLEARVAMIDQQTAAPGVTTDELRRSTFRLYPQEVVALVHLLGNQRSCVPATDQDPAGEFVVPDVGPTVEPTATLKATALMIESLLPFSGDPDHPLVNSLRMLAARLLGHAGPPVTTSRELMDAIRHYESAPPVGVVQRLVTRAAGAVRDDAAPVDRIGPVVSVPVETDAIVVIHVDEGDDSLGRFDSEKVAVTSPVNVRSGDRLVPVPVPDLAAMPPPKAVVVPTGARLGVRGHDSLERQASRPGNDRIEPSAAPSSPSRSTMMFATVGVVLSLAASGYGGYWLTRLVAANRSHVSAPISSPAPLDKSSPTNSGTTLRSITTTRAPAANPRGRSADAAASSPPEMQRNRKSPLSSNRPQD